MSAFFSRGSDPAAQNGSRAESGPEPGVRVLEALRRPVAADAAALLVSIVAVQGLVPLAQLGAATLLSPEVFGALRTAESVFAVALLIGSLGMPTLAVTGAARLGSKGQHAALFRRLVVIAFAAAFAVATVIAVLAPSFVAEPEAARLLRALSFVVVLAAASRTVLGFAQGIRRLRLLATGAVLAATIALPALLLLTHAFGREGWIIGRAMSEVLLLGAGLLVVRDVVTAPPAKIAEPALAPARLALTGSGMAASLLARGSIDAASMLALVHAGAGSQEVGYFGLGTLVVTGLLLPPFALYAATLPRLVARRADREAAKRLFTRMALAGVGITAASALLVVGAWPVALRMLEEGYRGAALPLVVLLCAAPLRALTGAGGNVLLAQHRVGLGLAINGASLAVLTGAVYWAASWYGVVGAATAAVVVESITALAVSVAAWAVAGRGQGPRNEEESALA